MQVYMIALTLTGSERLPVPHQEPGSPPDSLPILQKTWHGIQSSQLPKHICGLGFSV